MFEKKCQMCGAVFPPGTPAARKYCYDCLEKRHADAYARHREKEREKARVKAEAERQARPENILSEANRKYCKNCIYVGNFAHGYLCNYLDITKTRRGCKPGVGCDKHRKDLEDGQKRCERCGTIFETTGTATQCADCRRLARIENARRINERRWHGERG